MPAPGASLCSPPRGGGEEPARAPPAPRPRGAARGRAEEVSAAGRNASGRGARARAVGTAGQAAGAAGLSAQCLTSPWCRWTGRAAETMTTSRGSVGWTTGSAPSGRSRTVRAHPEGLWRGRGDRPCGAPRSPRQPAFARARRCGAAFGRLRRSHRASDPAR